MFPYMEQMNAGIFAPRGFPPRTPYPAAFIDCRANCRRVRTRVCLISRRRGSGVGVRHHGRPWSFSAFAYIFLLLHLELDAGS